MGMQITAVGNAGIHLSERGHTFLVDGIYGVNEFFHDRSAEILKAVNGEDSLFRHVEFLLFTHRHQDHFNSLNTEKYIRCNKVKGIYLPCPSRTIAPYEDGRMIHVENTSAKVVYVGKDAPELQVEKVTEYIRFIFFRTLHMGKDVFNIRHYSIVLTIYGNSYIFMSDAGTDYSAEAVFSLTEGTIVKGIFINPLAYMGRGCKRWLEDISPEHVFIYHIPETERGNHGIRGLADSIRKKEVGKSNLHVLSEPLQSVFLNER